MRSIAKGTPVLLEAARRAGVELTLIGSVAPDVRPFLARHEGRIRHLPPMPQDDLARHYREADVFCLPSWVEGSALVVYEAMASGLPCIVTPNAGAPCVHGKDGWLVEPGDPGALAEAFKALADPDVRGDLGTAARAKAEASDVARYGQRLVAAYGARHLTGTRARRPNQLT